MGKYQRTKGANGEREVVNLFKGYGLEAKRISMLETNGVDKGDVSVKLPFESLIRNVQVKIGQQVPKFIYKAIGGFDILLMRRDREKWLVTMDLETFIYLVDRKEIESK